LLETDADYLPEQVVALALTSNFVDAMSLFLQAISTGNPEYQGQGGHGVILCNPGNRTRPDNASPGLILDPCHDFVQRCAIGTKTIGLPSMIFISEGDSANDYAVVAETEVLVDEFRMRGQRRLRN